MGLLHTLTCRRCVGQAFVRSAVAVPLAAAFSRFARAQPDATAKVPGEPMSARSHLLDTAADALQAKRPINAMSAFLNGFHFYADDMGRQVEANHYCTHLTEDFHQCVIYASNQPDAKLIGIEYIVSERLFRTLPDDEKRLWHSHGYEVKSGALIAPGVPQVAEHAVMTDLVNTYGKTWHTWQIDRYQNLPLGIPQLMMGFTRDGQVHQGLLQDRGKRFDVAAQALQRDRDDIQAMGIVPGANHWESGKTVQLKLEEVEVRNVP